MMSDNNTQNADNIFFASPYSEGLPFLHDDATYYQQQQQQQMNDHEEDQVENTKQYGNDFRPTFYNPFEIKHRRRTSRAQFKILEKTFLENPKPNAAIRRWLAQKLVMTPRGVQVWFQNRRAKEKNTSTKKYSSDDENNNVQPSLTSEPLMKELSQSSQSSFESLMIDTTTSGLLGKSSVISSPSSASTAIMTGNSQAMNSPSVCACNDCCHSVSSVFATPMTRTLSYPTFYQSDTTSSIAADEEELIMTPATPFVEQQQQQQQHYFYDTNSYPIFMNTNRNKLFQNQQDWMITNNNTNNNWDIQQQEFGEQFKYSNMRRMYNNTNNTIMFDNRRFSQQQIIDDNKFIQSNEIFRRLSEPIFAGEMNQFDLLTRPNNRFSSEL